MCAWPHFESEGFWNIRKWLRMRTRFFVLLLLHRALQNWANQSSTQTRVTGRKHGKTHGSDSRLLLLFSYWLKKWRERGWARFFSFFFFRQDRWRWQCECYISSGQRTASSEQRYHGLFDGSFTKVRLFVWTFSFCLSCNFLQFLSARRWACSNVLSRCYPGWYFFQSLSF